MLFSIWRIERIKRAMPQYLACPACNKSNPRGATMCVRCECDLAVLWIISDAAAWHLGAARDALYRIDPIEALSHADRSWTLIHTSSSAAVGALAAVLSGQIDAMELWRTRWRAGQE